MAKREDKRAVYVISVAADLAGVHPQTLRIYERKGLVQPQRTAGNTRRYSADDIQRLARIQELTQRSGVNLAGVRMILDLESQLDGLRRDLERMADRVQRMETGVADDMRRMSREAGSILPVASLRALQLRMERAWREQGRRGASPIPLGPASKRT